MTYHTNEWQSVTDFYSPLFFIQERDGGATLGLLEIAKNLTEGKPPISSDSQMLVCIKPQECSVEIGC